MHDDDYILNEYHARQRLLSSPIQQLDLSTSIEEEATREPEAVGPRGSDAVGRGQASAHYYLRLVPRPLGPARELDGGGPDLPRGPTSTAP